MDKVRWTRENHGHAESKILYVVSFLDTSAFKKLPDLTIEILSLQGVGCPTGQGSCKHIVELKVTNLSNEPVNTPFNITTNSDNGLLTTQTIPFIPGSTSQTLTAVLGPGNNCWDPNCQIDTFVDSSNIIIESDETNNKDSLYSHGVNKNL